jgi:hypothetical protein
MKLAWEKRGFFSPRYTCFDENGMVTASVQRNRDGYWYVATLIYAQGMSGLSGNYYRSAADAKAAIENASREAK